MEPSCSMCTAPPCRRARPGCPSTAPSAACCSPAGCTVYEGETHFLPGESGARFAQRRETFRVTVGLPAVIEQPRRSPVRCTTLNLSIGGALMETERPFAPSSPLRVTITCGDSDAMTLAASVVRREHGAMGLAVAFTGVTGAAERTLSALIAAAQRRALVSR